MKEEEGIREGGSNGKADWKFVRKSTIADWKFVRKSTIAA